MRQSSNSYELDMGGGEHVTIDEATLLAINRVVEAFPGAKATWWRKPGERWRPIGEQRGAVPR